MSPDRLLRRMTGTIPVWVAMLALASTASACATTLLPAAIGKAIDVLLRTMSGHASVLSLWDWVGCCTLLTVLSAAGEAFTQFGTGTVTGNCSGWLRHELFRHILACGPRLTGRFAPGDAVSRLIGGTAEAGGAPVGTVLTLTSTIPSIGSVVALALIDPWLAVAFLAGMPLVVRVLRSFMRNTSDAYLRYQQTQGTIIAHLVATMTGARTIAAAGTREREIGRVLEPLPRLRAQGERTWQIQGRVQAQSSLIIPLLQVLVVAVGGFELSRGQVSPGGLLAAAQYAALGAGIGAAVGQISRLARGRSGATRAAELLTVPEPRQGTETLPPGRGRVEFRGVSVRIGDSTAIEELDLVIPAGFDVAVVGEAGAGKSTLAALAGRLADPDRGEVLLDGVPLKHLALSELREAVTYAFERPALLGRTVRDMIGFGLPSRPSYADITSAAEAARALQFLRRLPERDLTILSKVPLSGGEHQRLGLARAMARADRSRLLVLDDATSSLDTVTAMQVNQALTELHGDRTKIIVTHRAATAADADLVAWLEAGRLRRLGPHAELWRDPGYRAVFGADKADAA
ncbi:MAG: ABC transporter ATP-binding protein/permease [Streptosporangiales bacterium]|nr:ABC transporter ATP-binding protein/permease [Streptosporangiales bacterium]